MAPSTYDLDLDVLDLQEQETILPAFNADIAWEIGTIIRRRAQSHAAPIAIDIQTVDGHLFFHALSKPGTNLDNEQWVQRKRRTVIHFARSSFYMGCKLRLQNKTIEKAFFLDEKQYAIHGGGFPVRVRGVEGIIAVIVVSGLRQDLDHMIIYESLKEFLASYRQFQHQQQPGPSQNTSQGQIPIQNLNIHGEPSSEIPGQLQNQLPQQIHTPTDQISQPHHQSPHY